MFSVPCVRKGVVHISAVPALLACVRNHGLQR